MMRLTSLLIASVFVTATAFAADLPAVRVEPSNLQGPRQLEDQTRKAAIQDYLDSWQSLRTALGQNRTAALDRDFVGSAKDKLTATIQQQSSLGIRTEYQDRSHDLQILFYSPEGLSIQMKDDVEYDVQVFDHDKPIGTQHNRARYIIVMTPTEVRWRVRVLQAQAE